MRSRLKRLPWALKVLLLWFPIYGAWIATLGFDWHGLLIPWAFYAGMFIGGHLSCYEGRNSARRIWKGAFDSICDFLLEMQAGQTPVRRALNLLQYTHPWDEIKRIDRQPDTTTDELGGPWVLVLFEDPNIPAFAIWKTTGATYILNENGAAEDDPIYEVTRPVAPTNGKHK